MVQHINTLAWVSIRVLAHLVALPLKQASSSVTAWAVMLGALTERFPSFLRDDRRQRFHFAPPLQRVLRLHGKVKHALPQCLARRF